ncbi:MAG: glycosyltransferase family 4 protein [Candidatus Omnitrophica bacterium]|nr:glycosyltransferase family 4 protein [Candidatus Omnitrophota bacterium]MBU4488357.1 glycosyltransferase family 4 protein [Candidatus Omnitrophota bacterium]
MNILFVSPRIPYPMDSGAKIRTFSLLKGLQATHKVILLSFVYDKKDEEGAEAIERMGIKVIQVKGEGKITGKTIMRAVFNGIPLTIAKYYSDSMRRAINSLIKEENIEVVHFDHIHMGQYVDMCRVKYSVIDEHNVESIILKRLSENEESPFKKMIYKNECRKLAKLEKDKCRKASLVTVVSEEDKKALQNLCGEGANVEVVPNGVDVDYFRDSPLRGQSLEDAVVFTGAMDWLPNSDAAEYFIKDILPIIWKKNPSVKFYIVGKKPPQRLKNLQEANGRIIITDSVPDVRPYVFKSKVFIVPLRIGGGTRLKILEALSMEKAVVSTSIGAEGLNVSDGKDILIADTPEAFADRVLELLGNDVLRKNLGSNGRNLALGTYDWKIISERLSKLYRGSFSYAEKV